MFYDDFEYLLNYSSRKLRYKQKRSDRYIVRCNDLLDKLNNFPLNILSKIPTHPFYVTLRNLIRDLFIDWFFSKDLIDNEILFLKKSIYFFHSIVHEISDVNQIKSWFINSSFINSIADCFSHIDRLIYQHRDKQIFKQLIHLFDIFQQYIDQILSLNSTYPLEFDRLVESIMDCLVSSSYDRAFRKIKSTCQTMNTEQTFFLIRCPSFLISYHGSQSNKIIEQILSTMIPRYALLLDQHMNSISQWSPSFIHIVHHLLLTVIYTKDFYTPYANGQPLQWLIDHIVYILNEESFRLKIEKKSVSSETMLIDSSIRTLTAFVHEPDLLVYIKSLKITSIFRSLIQLPNEMIVLHAYVMLAYTLEENDIKASEKEAGRLLSKILDTLRKKIKSLDNPHKNTQLIEKQMSLLVEAFRGLVQHDQIKSEILKQNALTLFFEGYERFNHHSKRLVLESIGSITFDQEAARLLRHNKDFMKSIENIQSTSDNGIKKAAEKILWNVVKEPERQNKKKTDEQKNDLKEKNNEKSTKTEYLYDIMISYCHADKELVYRLHKHLSNRGFKIWVDRDNIYGPAMQSMADAVENSEFVLLCMSDSYKRSVYCQAEAEYAFRCKRHLLPCIVRQGYRADGWLGLVIGSRIYVDFGRVDFQHGCDLIVKEITLQRENQLIEKKDDNQTEKIEQIQLTDKYQRRDTKKAIYHSISIHQWTTKDVLDFLYDNHLQPMMPICELMTGYGLLKLFRLCQRKPSDLYNQLNEEFKMRFNGLYLPIGIYTQFLSEMDQFINSSSIHEIEDDVRQESTSTTSSSCSSSSTPVQNNAVVESVSQQISSPSSAMTTTQTSLNVQITEQTTAYRTESIVAPTNNLIVQTSQDIAAVRSQQIHQKTIYS